MAFFILNVKFINDNMIQQSQEKIIQGIVSRIESKDYYVLPQNRFGEIRCSLKGRFKKEFNLKKDKLYLRDIAVVGDNIEYNLNEDGSGVIYKIERANAMASTVWVGPSFYSLNYDDKNLVLGIVYLNIYPNDKRNMLFLTDSMSGKSIGKFVPLQGGLIMK